MGIRTGDEYRQSLRDDRTLHVDGNLVRDVTQYAPMSGVIDTIAAIYDQQHDPQHKDLLTFTSPASGEPVSKTYLEAQTADEFRQLAACVLWASLRQRKEPSELSTIAEKTTCRQPTP